MNQTNTTLDIYRARRAQVKRRETAEMAKAIASIAKLTHDATEPPVTPTEPSAAEVPVLVSEPYENAAQLATDAKKKRQT